MDDTRGPTGGQSSSARTAALGYARRGWRVVPLWRPHEGVCTCPKADACDRTGKHPRTRHGHVDATTAPKQIVRWKWETANLGIATGPESALLVLDVDPRNDGRDNLAMLEERLGKLPAGPMVATGGGGWHLYFVHPEVAVVSRDAAPGVEVKAAGRFVVAPPSLHKDGGVYRWQVGPEVPLPKLPSAWLGFLTNGGCYTDHTGQPKTTHDVPRRQRTPSRVAAGEIANDFSVDEFIESCVAKTLPRLAGQRHHEVFRLAKLLQGHSELATRPVNRFRPAVDGWYNRLEKIIGAENVDASIDENWWDFAEGWGEVKYPGEGGLMVALLERAKSADPPAEAAQYGSEEVRLLVALCFQLQREVGEGPFYLATSTVAKLFDLRDRKGELNRMRAWRWLQGLVRDGVLEPVDPGDVEKRLAASFRYLGPVGE